MVVGDMWSLVSAHCTATSLSPAITIRKFVSSASRSAVSELSRKTTPFLKQCYIIMLNRFHVLIYL